MQNLVTCHDTENNLDPTSSEKPPMTIVSVPSVIEPCRSRPFVNVPSSRQTSFLYSAMTLLVFWPPIKYNQNSKILNLVK